MVVRNRTDIPNSLQEHWMPFSSNKDFKKNPRLIKNAKGVYLKTHDGKTLIDANLITSKESIILKGGIISNIQLENAFDNGIYVANDSSGSLLYRVKVGNSGELYKILKNINLKSKTIKAKIEKF